MQQQARNIGKLEMKKAELPSLEDYKLFLGKV
jgi:hypothetical protein